MLSKSTTPSSSLYRLVHTVRIELRHAPTKVLLVRGEVRLEEMQDTCRVASKRKACSSGKLAGNSEDP
jgi:hypothetical protein